MMLFSEFPRQNQNTAFIFCPLTAAADMQLLHCQTRLATVKKGASIMARLSTQDIIFSPSSTLCRTTTVLQGRLWCRQVCSNVNV